MSPGTQAGYPTCVSTSRSPHAHGRSEIWTRPDTRRAIDRALSALGVRLRGVREQTTYSLENAATRAALHPKHLQRLENGTKNPTVATLAAIAHGYGVPLAAFFEEVPFRRVAEADARPYVNCVPLYSLKAAAGRFTGPQELEAEETPEAWVVPAGKTAVGKGLFVAQVQGESMNRRIPNGAYCLFRTPVRRPRSGQVILVQHREVRDPDHGGRYTVKVYQRETVRAAQGLRVKVSLEPDSSVRSYRPIVLPESEDVRAIAELVEVLPTASNQR